MVVYGICDIRVLIIIQCYTTHVNVVIIIMLTIMAHEIHSNLQEKYRILNGSDRQIQ